MALPDVTVPEEPGMGVRFGLGQTAGRLMQTTITDGDFRPDPDWLRQPAAGQRWSAEPFHSAKPAEFHKSAGGMVR